MTIDPPFERLKDTLRRLGGLYLRWMALTIGAVVLFGAWAPLGALAFLMTIGLPILSLVLWGRSLDEELGWMDDREGPW